LPAGQTLTGVLFHFTGVFSSTGKRRRGERSYCEEVKEAIVKR
jgi:hypothetical protein